MHRRREAGWAVTHFLCRLCALLVTFAIGLCALNYAAQRLALWAIVLLTLAACGPGLRDIHTVAIEGIDYVAHTPGGEF